MDSEQIRNSVEESSGHDQLPAPLYHHEIEELRAKANSAILPVRAVFRQDPLLYPPQVEVHGVATVISLDDGSLHFVTAFQLVNGARDVFFELPSGSLRATVEANASLGLALLTPLEPITTELSTIPLSKASSESREEAYSVNPAGYGATLGEGVEQWSFYQVNTLGVTFGYPILDREGALVGIGSHRYPLNPAFSLSVPASAVEAFLSSANEND